MSPCCPAPAVSLGTAVMIFPGVPVPGVTTLVVIIVMGDLMPVLLVTPSIETDITTGNHVSLQRCVKKQMLDAF